jgi:hemolysin-activating ACP:hemolysin acyltransferase
MSYALFNEETEAGYLDGTRFIQPDDWAAGDRLWLVDFIAPFGGVREIVREGRNHLRDIFGKGVIGNARRSQKGKTWFAVT